MSILVLPPLPYPPSINNYYARTQQGGVRIGDKGKRHRQDVMIALFGRRITRLSGPLKVSAVLHRPDLRRRDIDNSFKCLLDSLLHAGVYEDDSQIEHLDVRFAPLPLTERRGTVDITLESLDVPPSSLNSQKKRKNDSEKPGHVG